MAEKDEPLPTMQLPAGAVPRSAGPPAIETAPATMQVPAGAVPPSAGPPAIETAPATMMAPSAGPPGRMQAPRGAAPVLATMVPNTAAPMPEVVPPAMPQDWRYSEGREIARGGMGRVIEATDTVLGRTVALKEALSHDPDALRRFQRETRITARLEHPSIVPVHDAGFSPGGAPFYVMRKVGGRPLEELVGLYGALPDRLALLPHIVASAQAVAHAHERGIVHRDIKPSNILVGELGETILIDWGLAKAIGEADEITASPRVIETDDSIKTRAGVVFGTPGFMAPEQLRGAPVDERCDVYALGATLYHLLARRPPHHNKDADKMMRAAVEGPPTPLRAIVPGVPPELETIVDKALAYDANIRYQNAGALAEDLQRFLTGRLVAAHHYTAKEKLVRWVRQNRGLVTVSTAATLALLVGGTIAVKRVVDERDRADDAAHVALEQKRLADDQKEKVITGYQQLTLAEARHKAVDDPTRAVAMVRPLLDGKLWRQARDVIASARAHGIAFGLPASPHTLSLQASDDGRRLLAAGDDGIVRIHDLEHRTTRVVTDLKMPVQARFADGERQIVVFGGTRVSVVDAASGRRREIAARSPVTALEVSGPIVYWTDAGGALWKLDLAGNVPLQVPLDEAVRSLATSPDGRWVALAGRNHLLVLDRTQPAASPQQVMTGETHALAWSPDSLDLGALVGDTLVHVRVEGEPDVVWRREVGHRTAVTATRRGLYTAGPTGIVARAEATGRHIAGAYTLGLRGARGGTVIAADPHGTLVALAEDGDHTLASPAGAITAIEASPASPWVIAAAQDVVLVWNLDEIEPRHLADAAQSAAFVTSDHVIATYVDMPAEWIDLSKKSRTPLGPIAGISAVAPAPDGQHAIVVDGTHHARLVSATGETADLEGDITAATYVDARRYVVSSGDELRLHDGDRDAPLVRHAPASWLTSLPDGTVAAGFSDGRIWRGKVTGTGEQDELDTPATAGVLQADGTLLVALSGELRRWKPGPPALDETGISLATLTSLTPSLAATITPGGTLEVIDVGGEPADRWPVTTGRTLSGVQLAPDGSALLATTPDALLAWPVYLPTTAGATAKWLDSLTNARADGGPTAPLSWH